MSKRSCSCCTKVSDSKTSDSFRFLLILLTVAIISNLSAASDALTNKKIVIIGDYLEYGTRTNDVIVKGSAQAFNADMNINAQTIQANIKENKLFAYGDVVFWQGEEKNTGEFIFYDLKTGEGYLKQAMVFRGDQIISAETLNFSPSYMEAKNLTLTTCDLTDPDYKITASQISIKYGDHMEINDMNVYFKGKLIKSQKRQYTDLKDKPKLFKQKFGYSRYNGTYGKIYFPYTVNENRNGNANLSYYQRRGPSFSVSENLTLNPDNSLNYSYGFDNDDKSHQKDKHLNLNYQTRQGSDSGNLQLAFSSLKYWNDYANQELTINSDMHGTLPVMKQNLGLNLRYNDRKDLDGEKYKGDDYYSMLKKKPEADLTLPGQKFKLFSTSMNQDLLLASYHQTGMNPFEGNKYALRNSLSFDPLKGGKKFPFTLRVNEDWLLNYYSTEDLMQVGDLRLQLDQDLNGFRSSFRYDKKTVNGSESPFRFDNETGRESLFFGFDFNQDRYSLKLFSTSYDFDTKKFGGAYSDFRLNGPTNCNNSWSIYLKTDYDLGNSRLDQIPNLDLHMTDIYSQFSLKPKDDFLRFGLTLSTSYDSQTNKMKDLNGNVDFKVKPLTPKAHLSVGTRYDYTTATFTSLNYDLNYDLHCFDSKVTYNTKDKDVWFEVFMKGEQDKSTKLMYDYDKKKIKPIMRQYDF
ncbi:MAG: hypothetical protein PHW04_00950 [Candidatus Wallbacteria bacterium]|nr:hypothetical protein [Candidatus Wallbacteria bacterium]